VLKLAVTVFTTYIFRLPEQNDLVISKKFWSMTGTKRRSRQSLFIVF